MGDANSARARLADATKRFAAVPDEWEATAALTTPDGVLAQARAKAMYDVERKQVAYWQAEAAKVSDAGK